MCARGIDWGRARFKWKRALNASREVSGAGKRMGSYLCDTYINKETGRCWPHNATIADEMGLSKRSVQRQLSELRDKGWIFYSKDRFGSRVINLQIAKVPKHDKSGALSCKGETKSNAVSVKTVTHYNNQDNNQGSQGALSHSTVFILRDETALLDQWIKWIDDNTNYCGEEMLTLLVSENGYHLPLRHPTLDEEFVQRACRYFGWAAKKAGMNG